jgi:large subunit ribosomal protein L23
MTSENKNYKAHKIIIRPWVTEKMAVQASVNKYGFLVNPKATKKEIKDAIEEIYKVKPVAINISNVQGKMIYRGRAAGKRSDYKKAIVTLASGQTIAQEGV